MKKLYGVVTAMLTPFDDRGEVDIGAIGRMVDFLVKRRVNCLYPTGTTGEMHLLSVEERKRIAEAVVRAAAGRVTVYIQAGAMNLRDTVEIATHARSVGADGVGVVTPSFFGLNDTEMEEYYVDISKKLPADFPIYLYNIPQCSTNDIKVAVAERIARRCPNVVGMKYSYADMIRAAEYLRVRDGNFDVVFGPDRLLLPALHLGCAGTVSGVSSVAPEPFVAVYEAFLRGDMEEAKRMQRAATEICELLKSGSNMAYFKAALTSRGIPAGHMRAPLRDLPADEARKTADGLAALLGALSIPVQA